MKSVASGVVDGGDGYLYRRLSLQEAKDLCRDVQFYLVEPATRRSPTGVVLSGWDPEDYKLSGSSRLDDWYDGGECYGIECYWIRLDKDKPEYEPV